MGWGTACGGACPRGPRPVPPPGLPTHTYPVVTRCAPPGFAAVCMAAALVLVVGNAQQPEALLAAGKTQILAGGLEIETIKEGSGATASVTSARNPREAADSCTTAACPQCNLTSSYSLRLRSARDSLASARQRDNLSEGGESIDTGCLFMTFHDVSCCDDACINCRPATMSRCSTRASLPTARSSIRATSASLWARATLSRAGIW